MGVEHDHAFALVDGGADSQVETVAIGLYLDNDATRRQRDARLIEGLRRAAAGGKE